ncbi:MAG: serine/threonine protein kinase [Alphaproteobacteria bacterium]|nr:serine/threonine protein kinase [Alphaproteobacteria bacterium]
MDLSAGTLISDRYTVEEVIGEGGMAVVYRARHAQLGTLHALKVLSLTSRAVRERLLQEGRVQARLRHPNIVAVTDVIEVNGQPGLVMELVEGPSLDDLVKQQKLTIEQADAIGRGVLAGVAHAHAHGLIHRDLKPANVMLQITADGLVPKVTDFGLAKIAAGDDTKARTRTGATMGTPQYMSPEQIHDSKNVDARSDVFAVGAILYELVTGERAFDGDNLLEIFARVANAEYTDPRSLRPDLPERMADAILRSLVIDPDARVPSCKELFALWTAGESMPAHSFSAEELAVLAQSMLPPPSRAQVTSELDLADVSTIAPKSPISESPRSLAPSIMVGGGLMAIGVGLLALVALLAVGLGVFYARKAETVVVEKPVVIERTVEVASAPRATQDPAPDAPEPGEAPAPAVPGVAPSVEPVADVGSDTDTPEPDVPLAVTGEEGMAWNDLPEEMRDPAYAPTEVVEAPEPEEPEPVEPEAAEVPESHDLDALPMSLRSGSRALRIDAITRTQGDPQMGPHFVTLVRKSNDAEVRKVAFAALMHQWESGLGDASVLQDEAARGIRSGTTWIKWRGLEAWIQKGTSLQAPADALDDASDVKVRWLAARAVGEVARRTGQQSEAGRILAGRAAVESQSKVLKELEKQAAALGG